tara:strand:- start:1356 stop:1568 length:213 start_codon:yes stop_codon:yes gene_type:complete
MRQVNPGIIAYKNINTVKPQAQPKKQAASGLLSPKRMFKDKTDKPLQPVDRAANYVMAIREQREAYKNGA